ncbi:MAG: 3-hydroxyacyl-CoA dehydrogenase, partial [Halioglobus sp.]|nr:3-hydroxyacyl-CoA dehydrogenase [Halioglobus sp.]
MVTYSVEEGVAVLTINNPPVNALSQGVRQGIKEGVERALDDANVVAILLHCEGRTFIAGADITEFASAPKGPDFHAVLGVMENASKPVVAAIHGTALGGGLETALCCHYRVAVQDARFGLPEVNLGLLPGAGGTQRLPRLVGVEKATDMVVSGNPISAPEALDFGLIDAVVAGDLRVEALAFTKQAAVDGALPRVRDKNDKLTVEPGYFDQVRAGIARKTRGFLAPELNIQCIEAAVNLPFDEGLAREAELFRVALQSPESAAQQYFFFAERQAAKVPGLPKDTPERPINKVGIIGAGTMGGGIAMNMANVGIPVTVVETNEKALERGLGVVRKNYENTAHKGRISEADVKERMALFTGSLDLEELADCDLIIEAVFEN